MISTDVVGLTMDLMCRDGVVVRALASHQCGPGSITRLGAGGGGGGLPYKKAEGCSSEILN